MQNRENKPVSGTENKPAEAGSDAVASQTSKDEGVLGWVKWFATPVTAPVTYLFSKQPEVAESKLLVTIEEKEEALQDDVSLPPSVRLVVESLRVSRDSLDRGLRRLNSLRERASAYYSMDKLNARIKTLALEDKLWDKKEQNYLENIDFFCRELSGRIDNLDRIIEGMELPFIKTTQFEAKLDYFKRALIFGMQVASQEYCTYCNKLLAAAKDESAKKTTLAILLPVSMLFSQIAPITFDEKFTCVLADGLKNKSIKEIKNIFKVELTKLVEVKKKLGSQIQGAIKEEVDVAFSKLDEALKKIQSDEKLKGRMAVNKKNFDTTIEIADSVLQMENQFAEYLQQCEKLRTFYSQLSPVNKRRPRALPTDDPVQKSKASAIKLAAKANRLGDIIVMAQDELENESETAYNALAQEVKTLEADVVSACQSLKETTDELKKRLEDKKETSLRCHEAYGQFQVAYTRMSKFALGNKKLELSDRLNKLQTKFDGKQGAVLKEHLDKVILKCNAVIRDPYKNAAMLITREDVVALEKEKLANDLLALMRYALNEQNLRGYWSQQLFCGKSSANINGVKVPIGVKAIHDKFSQNKNALEILSDLSIVAQQRIDVSQRKTFFYKKLGGRAQSTSSLYLIAQGFRNINQLSVEQLRNKAEEVKAALRLIHPGMTPQEVMTPRTRRMVLQPEDFASNQLRS